MSEANNAYEKLINKITLAEFHSLFGMLCHIHPTYDVAVDHVLRVERGSLIVYTLRVKDKRVVSPIDYHYQRCAFVTFSQAGECVKHSDVALG